MDDYLAKRVDRRPNQAKAALKKPIGSTKKSQGSSAGAGASKPVGALLVYFNESFCLTSRDLKGGLTNNSEHTLVQEQGSRDHEGGRDGEDSEDDSERYSDMYVDDTDISGALPSRKVRFAMQGKQSGASSSSAQINIKVVHQCFSSIRPDLLTLIIEASSAQGITYRPH